jgi:hypothetical protein
MKLYLVQVFIYRRGSSRISTAWADVGFAASDHLAVTDVIRRMRAALEMAGYNLSEYEFYPAVVVPLNDQLITAAYVSLLHRVGAKMSELGKDALASEDARHCPVCGGEHQYADCAILNEFIQKQNREAQQRDAQRRESSLEALPEAAPELPPAPFKSFFDSLGDFDPFKDIDDPDQAS